MATFDQKYQDKSYIRFLDQRQKIVFEENRSKYSCHNPNKKTVIGYKVDGGIIKNGSRCDDALYLPDEKELYLIELKGGDYEKAIFQIDNTIDSLIIIPQIEIAAIKGRVVLSKARTPEMRTQKETRLLLKMKKLKYKFDLKMATRVLEESV